MKLNLEFMAICSYGINLVWEFSDHIIHESDRVLLSRLGRGVRHGSVWGLDGRILQTANYLAVLTGEVETFHIDLHMVPGDLFFISDGGQPTRAARVDSGAGQ